MRVLNCLRTPDVLAGTELSAHASAGSLRAAGHQVYLLHDGASEPKCANQYDGTCAVPPLFDNHSKRKPAGFAAAQSTLNAYVERERIDALHVQSLPRVSELRRWPRLRPTVVTVHVPPCPNGSRYLWAHRRPCDRKAGLVCLHPGYTRDGCGHLGNGEPFGLAGFARAMWQNHWTTRAIGQASRVVAIGPWMARRLSADGIPPQRIRIVPSPILQQAADVSMWTAPEQPPAVLFVGRAVDFKGADHLLAASVQISTAHHIWIAGGGTAVESLKALAQQLGIGNRTKFLGHLSPHELVDLRRRANVIAMPSLWNEAFGRVGVEAMAAARAVVAYDVGGVGDWLTHGETGLLVPVGDIAALAAAIERVLRDENLARHFGEAGARAAIQWTFAAHAEHLIPVLQEAIDEFQQVGNSQ